MTTATTNDPSWPITEAGIWLDQRLAPLASPRPALFLDRDGVIVEDTGFLSDPSLVALVPQIASLIKRANAVQIPVLVVTNQSGIDRGHLGWREFAAVESRILALLRQEGAVTDGTAACPFHPEHTPGYGPDHSNWRKPEPGMIRVFAETLNIDLSRSCLVGDRLRDVEAGRMAGLAGGFLLSDPSAPDVHPYRQSLASRSFEFGCGNSIPLAEDWLEHLGLFRAS
ncbi:MAG: HAD-IIIA family hydrolase [Rhodospirillaceae bacterium]|jgi:D-glycero-D-manno-heptose 1,7-bisphosphate phosphatase|nr:HAD-IIIA family hydrolase [Rhodospirillaceae bacterium]MBT5455014.1 HAD-IIIA family hydrolase [Rhodospirillaceae bacterium]